VVAAAAAAEPVAAASTTELVAAAIAADAAALTTSAAAAKPAAVTAGVTRVESLEEAARLIAASKKPSVLLVGGKWCRACKYASGQVKRVSRLFAESDVAFFEYLASARTEPLTQALGVRAVPTMLLNKEGRTIHQSTSCSDSTVIAADVESWLL